MGKKNKLPLKKFALLKLATRLKRGFLVSTLNVTLNIEVNSKYHTSIKLVNECFIK